MERKIDFKIDFKIDRDIDLVWNSADLVWQQRASMSLEITT